MSWNKASNNGWTPILQNAVQPDARYGGISWVDVAGNLYLFQGCMSFFQNFGAF
jgi:hypothetical protein